MDSKGTNSPTVALDGSGRVAEEVPCRNCGSSLRGLDANGCCPECMTAVGRSIQGDLVRFCHPDWVQTLARGLNWIIVSILLGIAMRFVAALTWELWPFPRAVEALLGMVPAIVGLVGFWKVTTADPGYIGVQRKVNARSIIRVMMFVSALGYPVQVILPLASSETVGMAAVAVYLIARIAGVVVLFSLFVYGRQLALRIPRRSLAKQTRIVMWGSAASFAVGALGFVGLIAGMALSGSDTGVAAAVSFGLTVIGLLAGAVVVVGPLFAIWALVLMFWYRSALHQAARHARETWARVEQPAPAD